MSIFQPLTGRPVQPLAFKGVHREAIADRVKKWTPAALFADGADGAWYDPSDTSALFIERSNPTTLATVGDPVGTILDKSGNDNHAYASNDAARAIHTTYSDRPALSVDGVDDGYRSTREIKATSDTSLYVALIYEHGSGDNNYSICRFNSNEGTTLSGRIGTRGGDRVYYIFQNNSGRVVYFQSIAESLKDGKRILAFEMIKGQVFLVDFAGNRVEVNYRDWTAPKKWTASHLFEMFGDQPSGKMLGAFVFAGELPQKDKAKVNQYLVKGT